jgi:hypothetical protein
MKETFNMIRRSPDLGAAVSAGLIAGTIMMLLQLVMYPLFFDRSAWFHPRLIAAIPLGRDVLPGAARGADASVAIAALVVHYALSILYAVIASLVLDRVRFWPAVALGAVGGFALYLINYYGFTNVFEWFVASRNWVTTFTHISFGIGAAAAYKALERPARRLTHTQPMPALHRP